MEGTVPNWFLILTIAVIVSIGVLVLWRVEVWERRKMRRLEEARQRDEEWRQRFAKSRGLAIAKHGVTANGGDLRDRYAVGEAGTWNKPQALKSATVEVEGDMDSSWQGGGGGDRAA